MTIGIDAVLLTRTEQAELAVQVQAGIAAEERLVRSIIPWCLKLVGKFVGQGIDYDDLVGEAMLAAVKAVKRFNPQRGSLTTLVTDVVWHHLSTYCWKHNGVLTMPGSSFGQLSESSVVAVQQAKKLKRIVNGLELEDVDVIDLSQTGDKKVEHDDECEWVRKLFAKKLTDREQQVMTRRMNGEALQSIGDLFGITKECVRQIEVRAICKMQSEVASKTG